VAEGGFVEKLLGAEGAEEQEAEAPPAPLDPAAAAAAMEAARVDSALSRKAAIYFEKQTRLVEIQTEHLHEQREVQISHLRIRRLSDRLKVVSQVFFILVVGAVGVGMSVMIYDAFASNTVVVDVFKAPPALASRGLTGDVVASGVLDGLLKLQAATRTASKGLTATGAWATDVKLELPETGISIGEISRILHERFGHDVHIEGELVQTENGGLSLTVRGDGVLAKTFQGTSGYLDNLTNDVAEYVYGQSMPFHFVTYLLETSRYADAAAFLPGAIRREKNNHQRARLLNLWGHTLEFLNKPALAIEKYRLAILIEPHWWTPWTSLPGAVTLAEGEEAGWREARSFLDHAANAPRSVRPDTDVTDLVASYLWDLPAALRSSLKDVSLNGEAGETLIPEGPGIADLYGQMHDPGDAARYMATADPDDASTKAEAAILPVYHAIDTGTGWSDGIPSLEVFWKAWQADPALQRDTGDDACLVGLSYGMVGRVAEADAVFKSAGAWSRCAAFHGDVLEHTGDLAGAERVWADGLKTAPDLPLVYQHRGISELRRGDLNAAELDFSKANTKARHFADPLKFWGDLLAKQGKWKDALTKYDEALKYAPAWTELHDAQAAAAKQI
jgi:tetratricopeptide (TPR) repeat protein